MLSPSHAPISANTSAAEDSRVLSGIARSSTVMSSTFALTGFVGSLRRAAKAASNSFTKKYIARSFWSCESCCPRGFRQLTAAGARFAARPRGPPNLPKHVLTSCAGLIKASRLVSLSFECFPSGARNLLRACGDTTAALRQGVLFEGCCVLDYSYASR